MGIENDFGKLTHHLMCLLTIIQQGHETANNIMSAALRLQNRYVDCEARLEDTQNVQNGNHATRNAYYNNGGNVSWHDLGI